MTSLKLEQYLEGGSIWGSIQALSPYPFFDDYSAEQLDKQTKLLYGEREVFRKFHELTIGEAAALVYVAMNKKWLNLLSMEELPFNLGASVTNKKTETTNTTENTLKESDNLNKVSAFNTEDLINDGGSNLSETGEKEGTATKITTDDKISFEAAYANLTLAEKISIINTVTSDVAQFLTLSIY